MSPIFFQLTFGNTAAAATFTPAITHANVSSNRKTVGLVSSSRSRAY